MLPSLLVKIAAVVDLEKTAREYKALVRKRKLTSAADLLKLVFIYSLGAISLRSTAALASALKIVDMEDTAVLGRLRNAARWLEHLFMKLLNHRCPPPVMPALDRAITIIDGTSLSVPGSSGTDWRLHLRLDPMQGRFTDVRLSDVHVAESLSHFTVQAKDLLIGDRFYAKAKALAKLRKSGGDFIVRIGWRALRLRQPDGQVLDIIAVLKTIDHDRPVDRPVLIAHSCQSPQTFPARLIIVRKSDPATAKATTEAKRKSSNQGHKMKPETALAAQFLMIITSLPVASYRPELVLFLYHLRWQVELSVKRLKSLLGLDEITAFDPNLVRTWLLAHLIAALLLDDIASPALAFSPLPQEVQRQEVSIWRLQQIVFLLLSLELLRDLSIDEILDSPRVLMLLCERKRRRINHVAHARKHLTSDKAIT